MASIGKQLASKELSKRRAGTTGPIERLRGPLTERQRSFIDNPSKKKLARCGRRAGKSFMVAVYMIMVCILKPDQPVLYLGLTRDSAMNIMWKTLTQMLSSVGIGYTPQISRGRIEFPNGSYIQIFGIDAADAGDRLRGQAWALIVGDEMGFTKRGDDLLYTLAPSLADYKGTMVLVSSPSRAPMGLFYECDVGVPSDSWYRVSWTIRENPFFAHDTDVIYPGKYPNRAEEELGEAILHSYGGKSDHPAYEREWLGLWTFDKTNLIYPATEENEIHRLQDHSNGAYQYAIGIDFGSSSDTAYAVLRFSEYSRQVECIHLFKQPGLLVDEMAIELEKLVERYRPVFIEADTGGLGLVPAEEMRRRYGLPINAAEKTKKGFYAALVRNDLASGYIKVLLPQCQELRTEWKKIVKGDDGEEMKGQDNHASDAFLYAYRKIYTTHLQHFTPPLSEEDKIIESLEKSVRYNEDEDFKDLDNTDEIW